MSDNNPTMLDISSFKHLTPRQCDIVLMRYNSIKGNNRGAGIFYALAQLGRLRLRLEHTEGTDFDSAVLDAALDDLASLLIEAIPVEKD